MEKGYYLCKVLTLETQFKKIYKAKILYWNNKWVENPDSFFVTKDKDVLSFIKIPDSYFETIIV